MKKFLLISATAISFISCSNNDDNDENSNDTSSKLKSIHIVEKSPISSANYDITRTFSYNDKGQITSISSQNGSESGTITLSYENDKLKDVKQGSITVFSFIYDGGKLNTVTNSSSGKYYFTYNGDQLSKITYNKSNTTITSNLTYSGNDISKIISDGKTYNIEYDSKVNPFKNQSFEEKVLFAIMENDGTFNIFQDLAYFSFWGDKNITKMTYYKTISYSYNESNLPKQQKTTFGNGTSTDTQVTIDYNY